MDTFYNALLILGIIALLGLSSIIGSAVYCIWAVLTWAYVWWHHLLFVLAALLVVYAYDHWVAWYD